MLRIILILLLFYGLVSLAKVEAMASLRQSKDVNIKTSVSDSCIKNVKFKEYKNILYIYGDIARPCLSNFSRPKVIISLLNARGEVIKRLETGERYSSSGRGGFLYNGSFNIETQYDPKIKSSSVQIQW